MSDPFAKPELANALPWRADGPLWRDLFIALLVILAAVGTAFIWTGDQWVSVAEEPWLSDSPVAWLAAVLTGMVWAVAAVGLLGRVHARRTVRALRARLIRDQMLNARLQPEITEAQTGLGMRYISTWLVLALGVSASAVLWQTRIIERQLGDLTPLVVGVLISMMFALAVAANAVSRRKARRLTRDLRTALQSERLALDTLSSLDVMISACLPTGERTRFNDWFLQFVGRSETQMRGHGWLEAVHPNDRDAALELAARPLSPNESVREHDLCVRHANGSHVWLHETMVPRLNERGELAEFICTAVNITSHVESAAALDKQIGDLKADLSKAHSELAEVKDSLSKTKASRNRFEKNLEESREEAKSLQLALDKAESALEKTQVNAAERLEDAQAEATGRIKALEEAAETRLQKLEDALKAAKSEHQLAAAENRKLARACEKLQVETAALRNEEGELREQLARHIAQTREAQSQLGQAHASESQLRAKHDQLIHRSDELEKELADARQAAAQAGTDAAAEIERRLREVSAETLASQLRRQLDGLQRMTKELREYVVDGPAREAVINTDATVRAMSALVNRTIGDVHGTKSDTIARRAASFDLRRTAMGVRDLLANAVKQRGVTLEVEIAPKFPPLLHGDDIEVRTVLVSLADAATQVAGQGTLILRLSEDLRTAAHSTVRCELRHGSARVKSDVLQAALAIGSTDQHMPDAARQPLAYQAAMAWRTIRSLGGNHGFVLPDEGGFRVWFTFNLARPAASVAARDADAAGSSILSQMMESDNIATEAKPTTAQTAEPSVPVELPPAQIAVPKPPEPSNGVAPMHHAAAETPRKPPPTPAKTVIAPTEVEAPNSSAPPSPATAPAPGRQMPRMPQEFLNCSLGEVVELGGDSIRILCAKQPKAHKSNEVAVAFGNLDVDAAIELRGEIIWSKKVAARQFDVGIRFIDLTPAQHKQLLQIAMQHRKTTAPPGST